MWLSTPGYSRPTWIWPCMIRQRSSAGSAYHSRDFTNGYTNTYLPRKPRGFTRSSSEYSEDLRMPRNEYGISAHFIKPLWSSTTWNSWMRSRFSASEMNSRSASPRVPTSEKRLQQVPVGEVLAGRR